MLVRGSLEVAVKLRRRSEQGAETGAGGNAPSDAALIVQDITYAGLEALRAIAPLDLCAYLHLSDEQGPQLFLATPTLASIEPTAALNLFSALRDALESGHDEHDAVALGGYLAITITTKGPSSRGLHVFGRKTQTFSEDERRVLRDLADRFGSVAHAAQRSISEAAPGDEISIARVAVETVDDAVRAEVAIQIGSETKNGTGEGSSPAKAVAAAALAALFPGTVVIDAREDDVGGRRAMFVLVSTTDELVALGSALVHDDPLRAAASAALDAASSMSR